MADKNIVHMLYGDLEQNKGMEVNGYKVAVKVDNDSIIFGASGELTTSFDPAVIDMKEDKGVVSGIVTLLTNEHLNTLKTGTRQYRQNLNANATIANGYPVEGLAGYISVNYLDAGGPNQTGVIQTFEGYVNGRTFKRAYQIGVWSAWEEVASRTFVTNSLSDKTDVAVTEALEDRVEALENKPLILPPATETELGAIIVGDGLSVQADGKLSIAMAENLDIIPTLIHAGVIDESIRIVGSTMYITFAIEEGTAINSNESLIEWHSQYPSLNKVNISAPIFGTDGNLYHCVIDASGSAIYFDTVPEMIITATATYIDLAIQLIGTFGVPMAGDSYTKEESDAMFVHKTGDTMHGNLVAMKDPGANRYVQLADSNGDKLSMTMTEENIMMYKEISNGSAGAVFEIDRVNGAVSSDYFPVKTDVYTKAESDARFEPIDGAYTKAESDANFVNINGDMMTGSLEIIKPTTGTAVFRIREDTGRILQMIDSDTAIAIQMNADGVSTKDIVYADRATGTYSSAVFPLKTEVYTKSESDTRYVNTSGDTMTGILNLNNSSGASHINVVKGDDTIQLHNSDSHTGLYCDIPGVVAGDIARIDKGTGAVSSHFFVKKSGDTMTGSLYVSNTSGNITVQDSVHNENKIYMYNSDTNVGLFGRTLVGGERDLIAINKSTGDVSSGSLMVKGEAYTKAESDAKFVDVSGDIIEGNLRINHINTGPELQMGVHSVDNDDSFYMYMNGGSMGLYIRGIAGIGPIVRIDRVTAAVTSDFFYTKAESNGRYVEEGLVNGEVFSLTTEDLDTLKTGTRHYRQLSNSNATSERHYPINQAGYLEVLYIQPGTGSSAGIIQRYTTYTTATIYQRTFCNDVWTAWKTIGSSAPPVGAIVVMGDESSPVDDYPGTTWAIQADGRYIAGGNQSNVGEALGANSVTITEGHLPTQIGFSAYGNFPGDGSSGGNANGEMPMHDTNGGSGSYTSGTYTAYLGSGSAASVSPAYTKFVYWKRTA